MCACIGHFTGLHRQGSEPRPAVLILRFADFARSVGVRAAERVSPDPLGRLGRPVALEMDGTGVVHVFRELLGPGFD